MKNDILSYGKKGGNVEKGTVGNRMQKEGKRFANKPSNKKRAKASGKR